MKLHDGEGFKSSLKPAQRPRKSYDVQEAAKIPKVFQETEYSHTGRQIHSFMTLSSNLCYVWHSCAF